MKRFMMAAAIGGAVGNAMAQAQTQVTIYGIVGQTVRHVTNAGNSGRTFVDDGAFYQSRLGFQGSEALGGNLSAFFALEMGFAPDTGAIFPGPSTAAGSYSNSPAPAGRVFGRQSLVGLKSQYGVLTFGRQYTFAHVYSGRFQPQTNPNSPALSVFPTWHVARWDNMVKYEFDASNGLGFGLAASPSEGNGHSWQAGASWKGSLGEINGYVERMQANAAGADTRTVAGLGGFYNVLPMLKAYLGGMRRTQSATDVTNNIVVAAMLWNATPNLELTLSGTTDRQTAFATTAAGRRTVVFANAEYKFSRRTSVYLEVDRNVVSGGYTLPTFMGAKGQQFGGALGIQHRF